MSGLRATQDDVLNIPDSYGQNVYDNDPSLGQLVRLHLGDERFATFEPRLRDLGGRVTTELDRLAHDADKNPPVLLPRTRRGEDLPSLRKHPSYVRLEQIAFSELGLAAMSHEDEAAHPIEKYALTYLFTQSEFGLLCPVNMTDSLTRVLRKFAPPSLTRTYLAKLRSRDFQSLFQGAMFMTEQAAGSDIAATRTNASRDPRTGDWRLSGDKWFCSNVDADLALVLAHVDDAPAGMKGIGLFLMPAVLPGGERNAYRIVRLKDKLGSRSMASGEVVLEGARAHLIGDVGRGFQQMADMVNASRLSNGVRAAGMMRRAVFEALYIARNRRAFGQRLIDLPLMQRQLLKLMLPAEQARSMIFQTATCLAEADAGDAAAYKLVRILTPLVKFRVCRDARRVAGDAMEVRGGIGYIEEFGDARLVRDAHLGSIWEGTSNIVAMDVARAVYREEALAPLVAHLEGLLAAEAIPRSLSERLRGTLHRARDLMTAVSRDKASGHVRSAATALYNITSAIFMAHEGVRLAPDHRRLCLADLVWRHRLAPRDPLRMDGPNAGGFDLSALLTEGPVSRDVAAELVA